MEIIERLELAGFPGASVVGMPMRGKITVRVRTDRGWVYEKFDPDPPQEAIDLFAAKVNKPAASRRVAVEG